MSIRLLQECIDFIFGLRLSLHLSSLFSIAIVGPLQDFLNIGRYDFFLPSIFFLPILSVATSVYSFYISIRGSSKLVFTTLLYCLYLDFNITCHYWSNFSVSVVLSLLSCPYYLA
jgi:hypothetical protein